MENEITEKKSGNLWVLAYDQETNERVGYTCCPKGQVPARKMLYEMDGYRTEVLTSDEVDELIARKKGARRG